MGGPSAFAGGLASQVRLHRQLQSDCAQWIRLDYQTSKCRQLRQPSVPARATVTDSSAATRPKGPGATLSPERTQRSQPQQTSQQPAVLPDAGFSRNFAGTYALGAPLGKGSFKTVFVGRHRGTGERVAVQIIAKDRQGSDPTANIQRIQREIAITKQLQVRPEVIRLINVFEDDKNVYMVTEMCDGGTLESYLRNNGRMPEQDAAMLVMDVLHVLAECNRQKVCYADIKPANILLKRPYPTPETADSRPDCGESPPDVRVIDFGCSQFVQEGTKLAKRTGTPLFLPPEMFMRHWGPEADLWSLGMVTYLMLSGRMPFWGGAVGGVPPFMVMQEILGGDITFDGEAWEGISADAVDFVDRLLDRDFNTRMTAEQALQHPWIVAAGSGEDLEECSLDWNEDEYNLMVGRTAPSPEKHEKHLDHGGHPMCTIEEP